MRIVAIKWFSSMQVFAVEFANGSIVNPLSFKKAKATYGSYGTVWNWFENAMKLPGEWVDTK